MKLKLAKTALLLAVLFTAACNQDPIFHYIMKETPPADPRIEGTPSNMVIFSREYTYTDEDDVEQTETVKSMYVGSSSLHWYAQAPAGDENAVPQWDTARGRVPQPGGSINSLAVTGAYLYALCGSPNGARTLSRIGASDTAWTVIASGNYDNIFAGGERLFIGGKTNETENPSCAIYYFDEAAFNPEAPQNPIKLLRNTATYVLWGAAFDKTDHYLITKDLRESNTGATYKIPDSAFPAPASGAIVPVADLNNGFMAIISLETGGAGKDTLAAVDESGTVFLTNSSGVLTTTNTSMGVFSFSRALGLYQHSTKTTTDLLIGYRSRSTASISSVSNNGYREFIINWDNADISGTYQEPVLSVDNKTEQYTSSLGKHGVYHIFQPPAEFDESRTLLFASTVLKGLWSFRFRDGEYQWNAEE